MDSFLSVDIGTSLSKGIILSDTGTVLAQCEILRRTSRKPDGTHENDAETDWWLGFVQISKELMRRDPNSKVAGIAISGMWPNLVLTDRDHRPISPAILYDDPRSQDICRELSHLLGANTYGYEIIPRLLWFKKKHPDILRRAVSFFTTHSYIVFKLTGKPSIDSHTALALGNVLDPLTFRWKDDILDEFEIDRNLFPPVSPPSKLIGHVTSEASKVSGLPAGIPVFAGFGDTFASLLGSGVCETGDTFLYAGSTGILLSLSQSIGYVCNGAQYPNEDEGVRWILSLPRSGEKFSNIIGLLCNSIGKQMKKEYVDLEKNSSSQPLGSRGVKIFYNIGHPPSSVLGTEINSAIVGLRTQTNRYEIYRASLEGFAFLIRTALEPIATDGPIFMTGGGARSFLLREILAHFLKRTINYVEASQGSLGGALLAASSAGAIDLADSIKSLRLRAFHSDPLNAETCHCYDQLYQEYYASQDKLRHL